MQNAPLPLLSMLSVLGALVGVGSACARDPDVVAVVDGVEVRKADVRAVGARVEKDVEKEQARQVVKQVVEKEQLAALARRQRLDRDADVAAAVRAAARDALAGALLERTLREATSEAAVRAAFAARKDQLRKKRVHVAHIVLGADVDAGGVLSRLRGGTAFADVARAVSADGPTAVRGGDLGPLFEGDVDAGFFAAAWALHQGETSEVVTTSFGRHILHALAEPAEVTPSFEEARSTLTATLAAEATAALQAQARAEVPVTLFEEAK